MTFCEWYAAICARLLFPPRCAFVGRSPTKFCKRNASASRSLPTAKHVFTHLVWHMRGVLVDADSAPDGVIVADDLRPFAFPTALRVYREVADEIL